MTHYELPSGSASVEYSHPLGNITYTYPISRKNLEKALKEALLELSKVRK